MTTKYCKHCSHDIPLEEWSWVYRTKWGERRMRDRCRNCQNSYQRGLQSTPEGRLRLAKQYKRRKAAGLIHVPSWEEKTPAQRAGVAASVRRHRAKHATAYKAKDRQYKALQRHPSYTVMGLAILDHYGHQCLACARPFATCRRTWDHIQPLRPDSPPADNDWLNLQPLCAGCNAKKRLIYQDYRPDGGAFIANHLAKHPELSIQSVALYRRPSITRIAAKSRRLAK